MHIFLAHISTPNAGLPPQTDTTRDKTDFLPCPKILRTCRDDDGGCLIPTPERLPSRFRTPNTRRFSDRPNEQAKPFRRLYERPSNGRSIRRSANRPKRTFHPSRRRISTDCRPFLAGGGRQSFQALRRTETALFRPISTSTSTSFCTTRGPFLADATHVERRGGPAGFDRKSPSITPTTHSFDQKGPKIP